MAYDRLWITEEKTGKSIALAKRSCGDPYECTRSVEEIDKFFKDCLVKCQDISYDEEPRYILDPEIREMP